VLIKALCRVGVGRQSLTPRLRPRGSPTSPINRLSTEVECGFIQHVGRACPRPGSGRSACPWLASDGESLGLGVVDDVVLQIVHRLLKGDLAADG